MSVRGLQERGLKLCRRANGIQDVEHRAEYESLAFAFMCPAEQTDREVAEWAECPDPAAAGA